MIETKQDQDPIVNDIHDAQFWIQALNRRTCDDVNQRLAMSNEYAEIRKRIDELERPWIVRTYRKLVRRG